MKYTEFTGKTVEEAVQNGLKELGLTAEQADVRVLEEGKKKLFGSVKARVEIAPLFESEAETETEANSAETVQNGEKTDGERTVEFLEGLFKILKITACTELVSENDKIEINVTATNTTSVIGKRGETLPFKRSQAQLPIRAEMIINALSSIVKIIVKAVKVRSKSLRKILRKRQRVLARKLSLNR